MIIKLRRKKHDLCKFELFSLILVGFCAIKNSNFDRLRRICSNRSNG